MQGESKLETDQSESMMCTPYTHSQKVTFTFYSHRIRGPKKVKLEHSLTIP